MGTKDRRPLVSVCMIARDEEEFIGRSIRSVRGLADEVWVADTGSRDDTPRVARAAGAIVFDLPWTDDFAAARNAVLERARGRWIVVLDADEWFEEGKAKEVRRAIARWDRDPSIAAFSLYQTNLMSVEAPDILDKSRTIRGFRNRPEHRYVYPIHEQIVPTLTGRIVASAFQVLHVGFTREVVGRKGKTARNRRLLERLLDATEPNDPHRVYLYLQHGREYQREGRFADAAEDYRRAIDLYLTLNGGRPPEPFASVVFSYAAEVFYLMGDCDAIFEYAGRLRPHVPFPNSDLPFFLGLAHYARREWGPAAGRFLEALACLEGAPDLQEYLSFDRVVLSYAGAVQALVAVGRAGDARNLLVRAAVRYPDRQALADAGTVLAAAIPKAEWAGLFGTLPTTYLVALAASSLRRRAFDVCLAASGEAHRRGDPGALPWAAGVALQQARPDLALDILAAIPADHPSQPLVRRLRAMAEWQQGHAAAFEQALAEEEPAYAAALRQWAGQGLNADEHALAAVGLQALSAVVPLPEPAAV